MELVRTKTKDLPAIKQEMLEKQRYRCPITGRDLRAMKPANLCVDHCHATGVIRGVLPRGINGLEGKVVKLVMRWAALKATDVVEIAKCLHGVADYIMLHRVPQTNYLHPTFKSEAEKRASRNALARKRYEATKKR